MVIGDYSFKICIFGDGGGGKTTLVQRYLTGSFFEDLKMTMGVDFFLKKVKVNDYLVKLQIWDFGGEERYRFLAPHYFAGATGGIFMYDISRYSSLNHLHNWLHVLNEQIQKVPIFFC